MIKLSNIKIPVEIGEKGIKNAVLRLLPRAKINDIVILKKSVDARDKGKLEYVYTVGVDLENQSRYISDKIGIYKKPCDSLKELTKDIKSKFSSRPIVIGAGPSGLFCALTLAYMGAKPILYERGSSAVARKEKIDKFFKTGVLDTECNVQFGEGGAGTFSDGKLTTGVNSQFIPIVLQEFVNFGATEDILYLSKPHIGTDKLIMIVQNMRKKIIELGGEVHFDSKLEDIIIEGNTVKGVVINQEKIPCNDLFLAIGHSARDTYEMIYRKNVLLQAKSFSMGLRIEHLQSQISFSQYGKNYGTLPPADYKLVTHLDKNRSLYTFCMCPGGVVINSSSEKNGVCVNGMSEYARASKNANSALLVGITPEEYGTNTPLDGIYYQQKYERLAYSLSNSYKAPVQTLGDFIKGKTTTSFGKVKPSVLGGYVMADLNKCLPKNISKTIKQGIGSFNNKIRGFGSPDSVLTGIEGRSSAPVRIIRNDSFCSSVEGLYPLGEGAGYAGGITSASVDGIKGAMEVNRIL